MIWYNYRNNGTVIYGHGKNYYQYNDNRIKEIVANYGSLSISRPDLIDMLKRNKPELVNALDSMIDEMLKEWYHGRDCKETYEN